MPRFNKLVLHDKKEGIEKLLRKNKIDINSQNALGETALHLAVRKGDENIVALLLQNGADINQHNIVNQTPIFYAASKLI